ncbi:hypothetical protein [Chryseobacterium sp. SN22]|uniref:hypothetical protein n=1 Tax=Chryseobacterium sp. SN22 TaxID=2606431 RepID=UPI0016235241|nr:hypothetical protein [Chryseobacterium sp. SN22]
MTKIISPNLLNFTFTPIDLNKIIPSTADGKIEYLKVNGNVDKIKDFLKLLWTYEHK